MEIETSSVIVAATNGPEVPMDTPPKHIKEVMIEAGYEAILQKTEDAKTGPLPLEFDLGDAFAWGMP